MIMQTKLGLREQRLGEIRKQSVCGGLITRPRRRVHTAVNVSKC